MSLMPQNFIGIKTCLQAKRPSELLNDLRPKKTSIHLKERKIKGNNGRWKRKVCNAIYMMTIAKKLPKVTWTLPIPRYHIEMSS